MRGRFYKEEQASILSGYGIEAFYQFYFIDIT